MEEKTYTFLLVSNRRGATRSWTFSSAWLKAGVFLSVLSLMVFGALTVDYVGLLLDAAENKRLRVENASLKREFQVVESKLSSLETGLERVQNFAKKLRLITNVDDGDRVPRLAMGVGAGPGQALEEYEVEMHERGPASEFLIKEPSLDQEMNLRDSGELSAHEDRDYASLSIRIDRAVRETQMREQGIIELWQSLSERQSLLSSTPNIKPARGWFTSRFGYRADPFTGKAVMHAGLDIAGPPGTPVYAPADGVVSFVGFESGYGKLVSIDHGYGVITRYGHNSRVFVELGQKVSRRDVISAIGSTGRSSGPHLHYEVRVHGVPVNPMNYILDE